MAIKEIKIIASSERSIPLSLNLHPTDFSQFNSSLHPRPVTHNSDAPSYNTCPTTHSRFSTLSFHYYETHRRDRSGSLSNLLGRRGNCLNFKDLGFLQISYQDISLFIL
jgi:hypothetical protein